MQRLLGIAMGAWAGLWLAGGIALAQEIQGPGLLLGATPESELRELSPGTGFRHAIAMHGEPRHSAGFTHFSYAEPLATAGGELVVPDVDTFDSLNPFIITGTPAWPVYYYVFDRLMARSGDEAFTLYGQIAEAVEMPDDRSWVSFRIDPRARFADGTPITVDDVIFSWETFRTEGRPNMRNYYGRVVEVRRPDERTVQFVFDPESVNRELPLIMGLMPVISEAYYTEHVFDETTLEPPLGSGPYVITEVDAGARLVLERNPNYWARELPANVGHHNFERITYDYYRDRNAAFEAFKAGEASVWPEDDAGRWATSYNFPAARTGRVLRHEFAHGRPSGMYSFVFNTRRGMFADPRVREAITLAFDFDWINANLFHNSYVRTRSYWDNSDLGALARADMRERILIGRFSGAVRDDVLEQGWVPPWGGDRTRLRDNLRAAVGLLSDAGYGVRNGAMVNLLTGEPLRFEIMLKNRTEERLALNLRDTLENIGVEVQVRLVDASQFTARAQTFDFDMMPFRYTGSLSPGNEQAFRYGSREATIEGTFNYAGVQSAAVDVFIDSISNARTREELQTSTRALDRTLLSGFYVVPLYHQTADRIAYWGEIDHPEDTPLTGYLQGTRFRHETWWYTPDN